MDLISRKRTRLKKREKERIKRHIPEEVFRKPQKAYVPFSKKLTVIVFVAFIVVLVYLFLRSEVIVKDQCGLMPGIECMNLKIVPGKISFEVSNILKDDYNVTLRVEGCEGAVHNYIRPNRMAVYVFNCTVQDKLVRKKIYMTYIGYSGLPHDKTGHLIGKIRG